MSSRVGSVFLGDLQRLRNLSSPPSSPPPTSTNTSHGAYNSLPSHLSTDIDMESPPSEPERQTSQATVPPAKIDPLLALELRLRWLDALILGVKQDLGRDRKGREDYSTAIANLKHGETLSRLAETVQQKLNKAVEGNEGLTKFMNQYDKHAPLFMPSFVLSGTIPSPPTYDKMSEEEIDTYLTEMEPEVRAADRDMLEIEALEKKGVTGAGRLLDYEELQPRLKAILDAHEEDARLADSLETRIASLVEQHATYVDTLSELFVAWDDTITEAEDRVSRMEREKAERIRLGLE